MSWIKQRFAARGTISMDHFDGRMSSTATPAARRFPVWACALISSTVNLEQRLQAAECLAEKARGDRVCDDIADREEQTWLKGNAGLARTRRNQPPERI